MTYILLDLSIDTNDNHIQNHIESGHNGKMVLMVVMVVMVVMEYYNMATNMFIIGVYGKIRENQSRP